MLYIPSERANLLWFSSNTDKRVRKRDLNGEIWQTFCQMSYLSWANITTTEKVMYTLSRGPNIHMREADIDRSVVSLAYGMDLDITTATAIRRLLKAGAIDRRMVEHGCYRHYVYFIKTPLHY